MKILNDLEDSLYKAYAFDYWTISDLEVLQHLRGFANWKHLVTVSRIRAQRWIGEEKSNEDRHSSFEVDRVCNVSYINAYWYGLRWYDEIN